MPSPRSHVALALRQPARRGDDQAPGQLHGGEPSTGGACIAHRNSALLQRRGIEARRARAGEAHELEIGQLVDQRAAERRALAHQADDVEGLELLSRVGQRLVENLNLRARQRLPVGVLEREPLVVVEHRDLHSILMLLSLTTLPQRAMLSTIHFCVASGPRATTSMPLVSRSSWLTSGSAIALRSSSTSLSMIGFGVPAGARMPHQACATTSMPSSLSVGTSGMVCERLSPVRTSARILPPLTCCACAAVEAMASSTWPPITSVESGPPPL